MAKPETVDRTIRNHRYQAWPAMPAFIVLGLICLAGGLPLVLWLSHDLAMPVMVGTVIAWVGAASVVLPRLPHSVSRVKLGVLLQTYPGGTSLRPSLITEVAFGPDPAEDYAEGSMPVRMCEARISVRGRSQFQLIVSAGDAVRLREWATEKGITVTDSDGYSTPGCPT